MRALRTRRPALSVAVSKGYAGLKRSWKKGDVIELNLAMPVRRVVSHEKVLDNAGKNRHATRPAGLLPRMAGREGRPRRQPPAAG